MKRSHRLAAVALLLVLGGTGCASVPLRTMVKLGGFDEADFADIDPGEVRIRIQVDEGVVVDFDSTTLALSFLTRDTPLERKFPLVFQSEERTMVSSGVFSRPRPVRRLTLELGEPGQELFREAQQAVLAKDFQPREFTVNTRFHTIPADADSLRLSVDLQLAAEDGFFPLFKDAEIPIDHSAAR